MNANLRTYLAAAIVLPLTACVHAAMMGGMGLGIGMMGHSGGASGKAMETHLSDASSSADTVREMSGVLREDLSRLRQVSPSELGAFMPEHNARLRAFLSFQRRGEMQGHDAR